MGRPWVTMVQYGLILVLLRVTAVHSQDLDDRPRFLSEGGNLIVQGGHGRDISFVTDGSGKLLLNGQDVSHAITLVTGVRSALESLQQQNLNSLLVNLTHVANAVSSTSHLVSTLDGIKRNVTNNKGSLTTIQGRIDTMHSSVSQLTSQVALISGSSSGTSSGNSNMNSLLSSLNTSIGVDSQTLRNMANNIIPSLQNGLSTLQSAVEGIPELQNRMSAMEALNNDTAALATASRRRSINQQITIIKRTQNTLKRRYRALTRNLRINECSSGPCANGGTCIDGYLRVTCLCRDGWMGDDCSQDVNECYDLQDTDLGCQNGGQCTNLPGSFHCACTAGWHGAQCNSQEDSCSAGADICGHGTCIKTPRNGHTYFCLCDQGWTSGSESPVCDVDINECETSKPHCSNDPLVTCINLPGSFVCGPCPAGYSGNGFMCIDIDECSINNGGCYHAVECVNTRGSYRCGPCPPGFSGDGRSCYPAPRPCQNNPCHYLATCYDNPQNSASFYQCTCPPGYQGNGIGPYGCRPSQQAGGIQPSGGGQAITPVNPCSPNPCVYGTCFPQGYNFMCTCQPGYTGHTCAIDINECASNPCRNGGTCTQGLNSFTCTCPTTHTGDVCQTPAQQCGGLLTGVGGNVVFPGPESLTYNHNISCAWIIRVPVDKVINVTFHRFHLEGGHTCSFDWIQVHDGRGSDAPMIGRFCGVGLPGNNGTIISAHNRLYLWFRSDHSVAGNGFNFTWTVQDPVCGEDLRGQESGVVMSPGYPGRYPLNRDCYWMLSVRPGKRIQIHIPTLQLEHHTNCSYDYLKILDGISEQDHILEKYCTTTGLQALTTSGSEALIHFHSDHSLTDTGFHITYSSQPGCGRTLTSDQGEFTPPSFGGGYEHNQLCEWLIRAPAGEKVQLNFTEFHLEHSSSCRWDYVEIHDGGGEESPLIGRFCSVNPPPPLLSTTNKLFVIFHSDSSVTRSGFTARYNIACGGEYTSTTGILKSPFYPRFYPHNRECVYTINQEVGKAIVLNFTDFALERHSSCRWDYVEVRDGPRSTSPLIGTFCGNNRPGVIVSTLNVLWIKFRTDGSLSNRGFKANYSTIDVHCGGVLRELTGFINSPSAPDRYPGNSNCRWVLDLPVGYVVQITWHSFVLESPCYYDYIEVYDNSTALGNGQLVGGRRYCGTTLPPVMTSMDNLVTVLFHSDASVNHDGFSASYLALDTSTTCGGTYHTTSGVIQSPRFPDNYPNNRECVWTINIDTNTKIRLNFTTFDLEGVFGSRDSSSECLYDYLEIRNGGHSTSPLIRTLCGRNQTVPELISHSHQLYLKFKTDQSQTYKGFKIFWDEEESGCGGTINSVTGELTSPGYPSAYHHRADCYWKIIVNKGSKIVLHFTDIDLESHERCVYDYVEVFDGSGMNSKKLGRFCNPQGLTSLTSSSNVLYIRFRSDWSSSGRGFRAQYYSDCNTVLTGHRGVIESPNFPNSYPHLRNCTWRIQAPRGNAINASFSHFDVEDPSRFTSGGVCTYDYVKLLKYNRFAERNLGATHAEVGHYCGDSLPPLVATGGNMDTLEVNFKSDMSVAHNGFRLEWVVDGCGGELHKTSGTFSSPNYPNIYPNNTDCDWYINSPIGTRIEIKIHKYDIESLTDQDRCLYDVLNVYGGPSTTSPILTSVCHKRSEELTVVTQGNAALVSLHSDGSVRGKGFTASYKTLQSGCGGTFNSPRGEIHSPNYPQNYDAHADCIWVINVDRNHVVKFTFKDFDVEPHNNCSYDSVTLYDGSGIESPVILQHCGVSLPSPAVIRSTGNTLTVRLKADGIIGAKGFLANYTAGCGARIDVNPNEHGTISSPNYPHVYTTGANCSWHLNAPEGSRVLLQITHLDINQPFWLSGQNDSCRHDYLKIIDGALLTSPMMQKFCGSHAPLPLISTGQYLTVVMQSDLGHGNGFSASYSVFGSQCGSDLTSAAGSFASPGYPNLYDVNQDCEWTINAGPGNRVQLSFTHFDLAESEGCNADYVEIHQTDASGPLLLHNCSSAASPLPSTITALDKLWVKFKSDQDGSASGFMATYTIAHGSEIFADAGEIASPMYPHVFLERGEYSWTVTVASGSFVSLTITELEIEMHPSYDQCFSSLMIYDGSSESAMVLGGPYCGYVAPSDNLVSSSNVVYIRLLARFRFEGSKFKLAYNAVSSQPVSTGVVSSASALNNCSYHVYIPAINSSDSRFSSSRVNIRHPGAPDNYQNNLDCEWIIEAPIGYNVNLRGSYNIEESSGCLYDGLEVYNGIEGTTQWNKTITVCRRNQRYQFRSSAVSRSDGRFMKLRFYSDSSVTKSGLRLFAYIMSYQCGSHISGEEEGIIHSSNYPRNYRSNQNCVWIINVRIGRTIKLEFSEFRVANTSANCLNGDYLTVQNGKSPSSGFLGIGKYCGNASPIIPESTSNSIRINFVTDGTNTDRGFSFTFREVSGECNQQHHLSESFSSVDVLSPNYPQVADHHTMCDYVILAPPERNLAVSFDQVFDITANYDQSCGEAYVEVRDGGSDMSRLIGKYCGSQAPNTIYTSDNALFMKYYSNVTTPHHGFKATVKLGTCGGTIHTRLGEPGYVTSPGYPNSYDASSNCTWQIIAPRGHYLSLVVSNVDIYNRNWHNCSLSAGFLILQEKNGTEWSDLEVFCNTENNLLPLETSSNIALLNFTADGNPGNRYSGFRLVYNTSIEECGGTIEGSEGEITSPGYPHAYAHRRRCQWDIIGPPGQRIKLEFLDFEIIGASRYWCSSFVQIKNGIDYQLGDTYIRSPRLTNRLCNVNGRPLRTQIFSSSMNQMSVTFYSSWVGTSGGRGFRARWTTLDPQECGGAISSIPGTLSSPGLSEGGYNHSLNCVWTLNNPSPSNSSFVVTMGHLDLERNCYDHVSIQGVSMTGRITEIKKICRGDDNAVVVVPYPSLRILFKTDSSVNHTGWNLTYALSNSGGELHGPQDVITSPRFPNHYNNNAKCVWRFVYPEGSQIKLNFTSFALEDSLHHDYVLVNNGPSLTSPMLGRFTGSGENKATLVGPSANHQLLVQFYSDESNSDIGFRALATSQTHGCSGVYHSGPGNLSSPNFPSSYEDNAECLWEIILQPGYHIRLSFLQRFDIESSTGCQNDYVQILQPTGVHNTGPISWLGGAKFCGKQLPSPVVSDGNKARILFRSNDNNVQGAGFKMAWTMVCGQTYSEPEGIILSPGHPNNYPNNVDCLYKIIADPSSYVVISFMAFELEGSRTCSYDYVEIFQGDQRVFKECGRKSDIEPVLTRGNTTLRFKTDYSMQYSGFIANYTIRECGGNISSPGILHLPTNPLQYLNNMRCVWNIIAPRDKVVHFKFQHLQMEWHPNCEYDHISVYNGLSESNEHLNARFCGDLHDALPSLVSVGNEARVVFSTDHSVGHAGLSIAVEFTHGCRTLKNVTQNPTTIQSIDLDNNGDYEPLLECEWILMTTANQVIHLNITRLDIEGPNPNDTQPCPYDKLKIYDGVSRTSPVLGEFCGNSVPLARITSSSSVMLVTFSSDSYNNASHAGFRATLASAPSLCGVTDLRATGSSQSLQSPGYPQGYPISINCRWIITAPENEHVLLQIEDLNIENSEGCQKDRLHIRDLQRQNSLTHSGQQPYYEMQGHQIRAEGWGNSIDQSLCGVQSSRVITSISNHVELSFVSDGETSALGFMLQYKLNSCNGTFNQSSGQIRSPGSGGDCYTTIAAPPGNYIFIYFGIFQLWGPNNENCQEKSLKVYDGQDSSATLLATLCGYQIPSPIKSSSNRLYLVFTRQNQSDDSAFSLYYTQTSDENGCGTSFFGNEMHITSPGYPNGSPANLDCYFTLNVPQNRHLYMRFFSFDISDSIGCNSTYIQIYNVIGSAQPTLFSTFCPGDEISDHLAPQNTVIIRYVTGPTVSNSSTWDVKAITAEPHSNTVFEDSDGST